MKKIIKAVILAAGYSRRMNLKVPKQLVKIGPMPILAYTLDTFERCREVNGVILAVQRRIIRQCQNLIKKYGYKKVERLCLGGRTRQESVFNALKKIQNCDYVIIHDGVRPFVRPETILHIIRAVKKYKAVSCAVGTVDTIVEAKGNFIGRTLCREKLKHIQTPQAFAFNLIFSAHQKAKQDRITNASDDTQLLLRLKKKVRLIEGSLNNIKITTKSDLRLFKKLKSKTG